MSSVALVHGDLLRPESLRAGGQSGRARRDLPPGGTVVRAGLLGAAGRDVRGDHRLVRRDPRSGRASSTPALRVFVAASGAIFGEARESPQREDTACRPATPYAIAKLAAHQLGRARCASTTACTRARGSSSTTSPSAGPSSSSRAGSRAAAAAIALGLQDELTLGLAGCRARLVVRGRHRARRVADAPAGARPVTTCSRAASATPSPSWPTRRSRAWTWRPSATCAWTPRSCAPPERDTQRRRPDAGRASGSAGSRRSASRQLVERMVQADLRR